MQARKDISACGGVEKRQVHPDIERAIACGPAKDADVKEKDRQCRERDEICNAGCRAHGDDKACRGIVREHDDHEAHRRIGKVDCIPDNDSQGSEKPCQGAWFILSAGHDRKHENRQENRDKAQAVEQRRVAEFNDTWVGREIFDQDQEACEEGEENDNLD